MLLEHKQSGRHVAFSRALCCKVWVLDVSCFEEQHLFHRHQLSLAPVISCDLQGGVKEKKCKVAQASKCSTSCTSQQQVMDALRLWVKDEFRCAKSGYSIDMRVDKEDAGEEGVRRGSRVTCPRDLSERAPEHVPLQVRRG